ncbi:MAG TPA: hypothetical protein VN578_22260 [Candidatus Binatia bacterium]|jgi:hypothetical protein|nr:hypothetical protein [Candidatus Binatia bacterium]
MNRIRVSAAENRSRPEPVRLHLWRRMLGVTIPLGGIWLLLASHNSLIASDAATPAADPGSPEPAGNPEAKNLATSQPQQPATNSRNTLLFEGDYEFHHSNDPQENHNLFVFQLSYGF